MQKGSDHTARLLYKKLSVLEVHFVALIEHFDTLLRTDQKMADRNEALAKQMHMYGEEETPGIQAAMTRISECFQKMQDHRRALVASVNDNILTMLREYETLNRDMKNEVGEREKLKAKQLAKQKTLEQIQTRDPTSQSRIKHAKVDRDVVTNEVAQADKLLIENMIKFQQRKLDDLKGMLRIFIRSQMTFHCRSLEILTEADEHVNTICAERDIQDLHTAALTAPADPGPAPGQRFSLSSSGSTLAGPVQPVPSLAHSSSSGFSSALTGPPLGYSGASTGLPSTGWQQPGQYGGPTYGQHQSQPQPQQYSGQFLAQQQQQQQQPQQHQGPQQGYGYGQAAYAGPEGLRPGMHGGHDMSVTDMLDNSQRY